jgi:DNA-binding transcriptional ArsR family regulator
LAGSFTTCQSTVSEHLGILRRAGLVRYTEQASRRVYALTPSRLAEVAAWSARYARPAENENLTPDQTTLGQGRAKLA